MENIKKLLDAAKAKSGAATDYRLAKTLGITQQRVSEYYAGKAAPNEYACLRIAEILGVTLDQVITAVRIDVEKDETRRNAWREHMKRLGGIAASIAAIFITTCTLIMTPGPSQAAPLQAQSMTFFVLCLIVALLAEVKTKLRGVCKKTTFGPFICQVSKMTT